MSKHSPVVVYRRGFFSSLVLGFFGTLCVVIVCGTAVALFGVKVVNDRLESIVAISPQTIEALTQWQQALPPAMTDALNDRRMPEYRDNVQVTAELVRDWDTDQLIPIIEVTNDGTEVVSLMSIRLQVENDENLPLEEKTVYVATPLAIEDGWRGPLLPGSKRRFRASRLRSDTFTDLSVTWEICELRVWDGPESAEAIDAPDAATEAVESTAFTSDDAERDRAIELFGNAESASNTESAATTDLFGSTESYGEAESDEAEDYGEAADTASDQ